MHGCVNDDTAGANYGWAAGTTAPHTLTAATTTTAAAAAGNTASERVRVPLRRGTEAAVKQATVVAVVARSEGRCSQHIEFG